jgi:hypothetical protein
MSSRYPSRSRLRSRFRKHYDSLLGSPKFTVGDVIGNFTIVMYMGHSDVNKRNNHIMSKPQHWYRCECSCGRVENRSQQELIDIRRNQCCYHCRESKGVFKTDESNY